MAIQSSRRCNGWLSWQHHFRRASRIIGQPIDRDIEGNDPEFIVVEHDLMMIEHKGTLEEFQSKMEELHRRAAGEGEWNDEAWEALDEPNLN